MEMASFPHFPELPPELQLQILEESPESLPRASRTSSTLRQLTEQSLIDRYCFRPISQHEFKTYLQTRSSVGIGYSRHSDFLFQNYWYTGMPTQWSYVPLGSVSIGHYRVYLNYGSGNSRPVEFPIVYHANSTEQLDLKSEYQILSQRYQCVQAGFLHHHNYPRDRILESVNSIYNLKHTGKVYDVCCCFILLAANARILQILSPPVPFALTERFSIDENGLLIADHQYDEELFDNILNWIDILYHNIGNYFLAKEPPR
jgi:hypothetical protein